MENVVSQTNLNENVRGLSVVDAADRLKSRGPNILVPKDHNVLLRNLSSAVTDPMVLMLLVLAVIYWFTGEQVDGAVLLIALVPLVLMDVFFNWRTDASLRALRKSAPSNCFVIRDGRTLEVPAQDLVPDDVLVFEEGLILPADGRVYSAAELEVSEASLTGESVPIAKNVGDLFYAGSVVVHGRGLGVVVATGTMTKFGATAATLKNLKTEVSPLLRQIHRMIRWFFLIAVIGALALFVVEIWRGVGWVEAVKSAATLAMAAIPEEFTIVYSFFLSLAAFHLSRQGVLVRSSPAIETLGRINVLCTDKTGTLTTGRFSLDRIIPFSDVSAEERHLALRRACEPQITDTIERAIESFLRNQSEYPPLGNLLHDYTFDSKRKVMSHVWQQPDGKQFIAMKGAWEGVRGCCEQSPQVDDADRMVQTFSGEAYRILALAARPIDSKGIREQDEQGLELVALLLFADPVRPSVPEAIRLSQDAGIEIKLMSGDHLLTTVAVADRVGIHHGSDDVFGGEELDRMNPEDRDRAYLKGRIFGRVTGEHKMQLVQALKKSGRVVAMIGDGINDLTALKSADVGVSMGETATPAARETAKLILFREDFSKLIAAMMEGRQIFASLKRSFTYLIAFHIPIVAISILGPTFGAGPIWLPIHIILFEFLVHPMSAFAFLSRGAGLSPSLPHQDRLISRPRAIRSASLGLALSLFCGGVFYYFLDRGVETARSLTVLFFILGNLALVALSLEDSLRREWRRLVVTAASVLVVCGLLFQSLIGQRIFYVQSIDAMDAFFCSALAIGFFLVFQFTPGGRWIEEQGTSCHRKGQSDPKALEIGGAAAE